MCLRDLRLARPHECAVADDDLAADDDEVGPLQAGKDDAGNGIVRLQAVGDRSLDGTAADLERFRGMAAQSGGSVVVARCPSDWKSSLSVWGPRRSDWGVAEQVKRALDPGAVFNPGRFVGNL